MIKQVIFDMDGLMLDSERYMWVVNETKIFNEMGYETDLAFLVSFMGQGKEHTIHNIVERYGEDFPLDEFYEKLYKANAETVDRDEIPLKEGFLDLMKYLKTTDIKITVGTSSKKDYVKRVLAKKGIIEEFDSIVYGDEVEHTKPDPDIYLKCMSRYNFDPKEVIVFEDADSGGRAALTAGCRLIMVKDMANISKEVASKAEAVLTSLTQAIDIIKAEYEATTRI